MSKSEGNVIDPVDLIDGIDLPALLIKRTLGLRNPETAPQVREDTMREFPNGIPAYGADAVRMTFASLATQGRGINFSSKRCEGYRNFLNKIWNAARFVLMQCEGHNCSAEGLQSDAWSTTDRWMMSTLHNACATVERYYQDYRLDNVTATLYDLV